MREPGWVVVVPVKRLAGAKSRLQVTPLRVPHASVVLAMATDTAAAALACRSVTEVLVVTDDPAVRRAVAGVGARVVPDRPAAGLNPAVQYGAERAGGTGRAVAVITADLPALRPAELAAALAPVDRAPSRRFVADAAGTGTTLLAAPGGVRLDPRFGAGSAQAHRATGAEPLDGDLRSLRRDVDTLADLVEAARLGLGAHTAALAGDQLEALASAGGPAGQRA